METLEDLYLAGRNPEYDANAKKLLASRKILAWILKYCVPEFEDSTIEDIRDIYIQGTPEWRVYPSCQTRPMLARFPAFSEKIQKTRR